MGKNKSKKKAPAATQELFKSSEEIEVPQVDSAGIVEVSDDGEKAVVQESNEEAKEAPKEESIVEEPIMPEESLKIGEEMRQSEAHDVTESVAKVSVPYQEKKRGNELAREQRFEEAITHYENALYGMKALFE